MTYIQQGETWATTRSKINQVIKVSYTDLLADTELTYTGGASGTVTAGDLYPTTEGNWFEVAASDAVDQHITTAGGVKLYEAGPHFSTRARAVAAWARKVARSETQPVGTVWTWPDSAIRYDGVSTSVADFSGWADESFGALMDSPTFAGPLAIGSPDDSAGVLNLYSNGTGSPTGGIVRYYIAPDYDTTDEYWQTSPYQDDLLFALSTSGTILQLSADTSTFGSNLIVGNTVASGDEGGQIQFKASPNSTLGSPILDVWGASAGTQLFRFIQRDAANSALVLTVPQVAGTLWSSGNDGSGSGLDADLLDGQEGSYYLSNQSFASRAAAVTAWGAYVGTPAIGTVWTFDGLSIEYDGTSTAISDFNGWKASGRPNIKHHGVVPSDTAAGATTDYTTEVQEALSAAYDELDWEGWVKTTDKVVGVNKTAINFKGRNASGFSIWSDFNLAATCVYQPGTGEPGQAIKGELNFSFEQPTTAGTVRGDLTQYPPAIDIGTTAIPRVSIEAIRIERGWHGIRGIGNCGGLHIERMESGCFGDDLYIDGALDFCHIDSIHVWPFGFAGNSDLTDIFYDETTYGTYLGRADGCAIDKLSTFRKKIRVNNSNAASILPMTLNSLQLDADGATLQVTSGDCIVGQLYTTKTTAPTTPSILVDGGDLYINSLMGGGGETNTISVTSGYCHVGGGTLKNTDNSEKAAVVTGGVLSLDSMRFEWNSGSVRTAPFVENSSTGVLRVTNCWPAHYTNASQVINVTADLAGNYVDGQAMRPHTMALPTVSVGSSFYKTNSIAWTPEISVTTPGDLSLSYGVQDAEYMVDGDLVHFLCRLTFTPTFTTASGAVTITGIPALPVRAGSTEFPISWFRNVNTGTLSNVTCRYTAGETQLRLFLTGGTAAATTLDIGDMTSGTQVEFLFEGTAWRR